MTKKETHARERRQYLRLDTVFPVQFRLLGLNGNSFLSDWLQGFTNDVGKGGICLRANKLNHALVQLLQNHQATLFLEIEMPFRREAISAKATVAWLKQIGVSGENYHIGLKYEQINLLERNRIMRYAWAKKLFVPAALSLIVLFGLGLALGSYLNLKLIHGNKALIGQLVTILQDSSVAKQKIKQISKERSDLQLKIQTLELQTKTIEGEKAAIGERAKLAETKTSDMIKAFNQQIAQIVQEKNVLQEQLISLQNTENSVTEDLLRLDKRKVSLTQANFDKMYRWLKIHQNHRSGLVISFEGDADISGWAFTYDQALVLQAYANFADYERARKILDFYANKARKIDGLFLNAYYANDGAPAEFTVHSGPNIWLGIAVLQFSQQSQDNRYLYLAEEIAQAIINLQKQDREGGIRGGPQTEWYATEHNLDAYAFFNMLYKITKKESYLEARDTVLNWLVSNTYNKADAPIIRGKGDATIATDTYAWSVAAIGPEKLEQLGMNADQIMEFAETNCAKEVSYTRPEGQTIKIKGFDFAPQRHLARGGVVSSEWTAQMVLSYKIMADFYHRRGMIAKARAYEAKADEYLAALYNMIISSPSPSGQGEGCLPYASSDAADTGHGWSTPKGKTTGSVAGTSYTIFAYYNYNPLELKQ